MEVFFFCPKCNAGFTWKGEGEPPSPKCEQLLYPQFGLKCKGKLMSTIREFDRYKRPIGLGSDHEAGGRSLFE